MNTVFVHSQKIPFDPKRVTDIRIWRIGMQVRDVIPDYFAGLLGTSYIVTVNGQKATSKRQLIKPGDHVTFTVRPSGVDPVTVTFLGKAIFLEVPAWLGATAAAIGNLAIAYFVGKVIGPPAGAQDRDESFKSKTYQFGGIRSSRDEGTPIPVWYGQFRSGGVIISESIDFTLFNSETTYRAIFLLSHGPISSVGGKGSTATGTILSGSKLPSAMEINGNSVQNFEGVEAQVRVGTTEQDPVYGFEGIPTVNDGLSFTLQQNEDPADFPATGNILTTATYSNKATSDAQFDVFGEVYDITDEVDYATLQIQFPKGLYRVDTSGNILPHTARFIAKYQELDSGGLPITIGGPSADGFVRLPPFSPITTKKTDAFTASLAVNFVDPQTFTFPTIGEVLVRGTAGTAVAPITSSVVPFQNYDEISLEFWIGSLVGSGETYGSSNADEEVIRWLPANFGFGVKFRKESGFGGQFIRVTALCGDGTSVTGIDFLSNFDVYKGSAGGALLPITNQWRHLCVTYKRSFNGGALNRFRLYIDGALRETIETTLTPKAPGSGSNLTIGASPAQNPSRRFDEVRLVGRELTADEVASSYNVGDGTYGDPTTDLIAGFHFDTGTTTTPDYSTNSNNMSLSGGPAITSSSAGKVFSGVGTENRKRSRYRVVVMRNSLDGTNDKVSDEAQLSGVTTYLEDNLSYPESALVAVTVPASEQLSGSAPEVTFRGRGRICPKWNGSSLYYEYSDNPAWCSLDAILNKDYGGGKVYEVGDVYLDDMLEWANHCDELVDNKRQRLEVEGAGSEIVDFFYHNNVAFGSDTWDEVLQIMGTGQTDGITFDAWRKLGKPQVGDYLIFEGCPNPNPSATYPTGINGVDGAIGFTPNVDVSISGGLEIVYIRTFGNSVEIFCQWPGVGLVQRPWIAGNLMSTYVTVTGGTCRKQEKRYRCDGIFDVSKGFWDALMTIGSTGRAVPVPIGDKIRMRFDAPSSAVDVIGLGNIVKGSFELEYTGPELKPNVMLAEFWDEAKNWERSFAWIEHPNVQQAESFEGYRVIDQTIWGQTSRSQVMRFGMWQLNMMQLLTRSGRFTLGPDSIPYEAGDVVMLHHALINDGISGRIAQSSATALEVYVDTPVFIPSAGTYEITVRDTGTGENKTAILDLSGVGSFPHIFAENTAIPLSGAGFDTFLPETEDVFVFSLQGEGFRAKIASIKKKPNQSADVEFIEYKDEVYDDDTFDPILDLEWQGDEPSVTARTIPGIVESPRARILGATGSGGTSRGILHVDWEHDPGTLLSLHRTEIYVRRAFGDREVRDRSWRQLTISNGRESHAEVEVDFTLEDQLEVAIRPINAEGLGRPVNRCAVATVQMWIPETSPLAPLALSVEMARDRALYSLVQPTNARAASLAPVVRRGGWILGLPGFSLPPGTSEWGPTLEWSGSSEGNSGKLGDTLYARNRTWAGNYSRAVALDTDLDYSGLLPLQHFVRQDQSWEDYGSGFTGGADVPAPILTDGVVSTDWKGDKFIEFTGSALTMVYTTSLGVGLAGQIARECFCEVVFEAEQVHPLTIEDLSLHSVSSHEMAQWTGEGPIADVFPRCEVSVEIKEDGVWKRYKPGTYRSKSFLYRFTITRPSAEYNVRIYRIATRARRVPYRHYNRNMVHDAGRTELLNG